MHPLIRVDIGISNRYMYIIYYIGIYYIGIYYIYYTNLKCTMVCLKYLMKEDCTFIFVTHSIDFSKVRNFNLISLWLDDLNVPIDLSVIIGIEFTIMYHNIIIEFINYLFKLNYSLKIYVFKLVSICFVFFT